MILPSDFTRILLITKTRTDAFTHNRSLNGLSAPKSDNNCTELSPNWVETIAECENSIRIDTERPLIYAQNDSQSEAPKSGPLLYTGVLNDARVVLLSVNKGIQQSCITVSASENANTFVRFNAFTALQKPSTRSATAYGDKRPGVIDKGQIAC